MNEIRATLAISASEAESGTSRTLTLPGGRRVTVSVPAGAYDGQTIRIERLTGPGAAPGEPDTLTLTLAVQKPPQFTPPVEDDSMLKTMRSTNPHLQRPAEPYFPPNPAPNPGGQQSASPLLQQGQPPVFAPPPPPPPPQSMNRVQGRPRSPFFSIRTWLLGGLALLIILSAAGIFYVVRANQIDAGYAAATATAQARFNATISANETSTAQANATATTVAANASATAAANATATAATIAANPNPYPGGGTLALFDPLTNNNSGFSWGEASDKSGACKFVSGAYHVIINNVNFFEFCSEGLDFSNFAFEVQMKILKGDGGGLIFRLDRSTDNYYIFYVNVDGSYNFAVAKKGTQTSLINTATSSAINQGVGQLNTIAVVAQGSTITLYVNHQQLTSISNSTFTHGEVGVIASPFSGGNGHPTEVAYTNARVWTY